MAYPAVQSSTPYYHAYKLPEYINSSSRHSDSTLPGYFTVSALASYSNHHASSIAEPTGEGHGAKRRVAFSPAHNGGPAVRSEATSSIHAPPPAARSPPQPHDAPFYTHPGSATLPSAAHVRQRDGSTISRGTAGALAKLTDELDSVRSAWRNEGQDLRSKMV
jgi:hypothetical protein